MIAVADTGPLLALAKVNALDLLTQLYRPAITTPTVFTEVVTAGLAQNAPDVYVLEAAFKSGWLQVRTPTLASLPRPALVHRGEEESIRLAIELTADWLLVDDLEVRRVALDNLAAAGVSTRVIGLVNAIKARPDIWISRDLCDQVIRTIQRN